MQFDNSSHHAIHIFQRLAIDNGRKDNRYCKIMIKKVSDWRCDWFCKWFRKTIICEFSPIIPLLFGLVISITVENQGAVIVILEGTFYEGNPRLSRDFGASNIQGAVERRRRGRPWQKQRQRQTEDKDKDKPKTTTKTNRRQRQRHPRSSGKRKERKVLT